ncbi:glycosyltransferase family 2 protein [Micromonospora chokoriensis]|uniref:Glycosyl transferase family 2 n=1 Tax=Micromonospora chokoriensis TaxID=356851 RepID=A0A1C4XNE0_9ACTN|nr:glycosyltransferase family 2 protein [Micromonospora chokoriensis]SCF09641.1 Glycosyl transferase family 2 [Micromonospora chokoriensis]
MNTSVIVTTHHLATDWVETALASLSAQTGCPAYEVIVVREDSRRELDGVIAAVCPGLDVSIIRAPDRTPVGAARNMAAEAAAGEVLCFLDGDDAYEPDCVATVSAGFAAAPEYDIVYGNSRRYDRSLRHVLRDIDSSAYHRLYERHHLAPSNPLFHSVFIGHPFAVRASAFKRIEGFDETKPCAELTDFMLKSHVSGAAIGHVDAFLCRYRDSPNGLSKHVALHRERSESLRRWAERALLMEIRSVTWLGRVAPYRHAHYQVTTEDGDLLLPYLDYDRMTLREEVQ